MNLLKSVCGLARQICRQMLGCLRSLRWLVSFGGAPDFSSVRWLVAPRLAALGFSVRTTVAALLALAIAFQMELGEPQWAPMTVWIVAQGTRGESISKARWRIVGTLAGIVSAVALIAAVPQQAWLFFPLLAGWIGLCTALGTLVHNFRSYAFVLTAYTCAIVSLSAVDASDQVFDLAMARGTYILLGVVCEMAVAAVFVPNVAGRARETVRARLQEIISQSAAAVRAILLYRSPPESDLHRILSLAFTLNDRIEFSAIEAGPGESVVRYARGTLGQVVRFTSRGLGMRSRLAAVGNVTTASKDILRAVVDLLERMPGDLGDPARTVTLHGEVQALYARCSAAVQTTLRLAGTGSEADSAVDDRIVLQGLALLLMELVHMLGCYAADPAEIQSPARFRLVRPADWRATIANGARSFIAVIVAVLIWEVTAWPEGAVFVTFVAVICARFASFSDTILASKAFFMGAVWAVLAAIVPVFFVMPVTADYTVLCFTIGLPMVVGGLAARNAATEAMAASFGNFFPYMLGLENHFRISEAKWFNTAFALLCGLGFGVLVFRYILPFNLASFSASFRATILSGLRRIGRSDGQSDEPAWVGKIVQGMGVLITNGARENSSMTDTWLHHAFSIMTVGRNLLYVRMIFLNESLPEEARTMVSGLFRILLKRDVPSAALLATADHVLSGLREMERRAQSSPDRLQLTALIGCLMIVTTELRQQNVFFGPTRTMPFGMAG